MRYRSASSVPGGKRPSLECADDHESRALVTVAAGSKGAPQDRQNFAEAGFSAAHLGHLGMSG